MCIVVVVLRWRYVMEFQYNPDTWNPLAIFIDDRTGRPPAAGLTDAGVTFGPDAGGIKKIRRYTEADFGALVGTTFFGGVT